MSTAPQELRSKSRGRSSSTISAGKVHSSTMKPSCKTRLLTGATRDFRTSTIYYYELNFRHDIPNTDWAWGINYERFQNAPNFRRNARTQFEQPKGFAWAFIEHKDVFGMTGSVFFANLLDSDDNLERLVFAPDRRGDIVRVEDRSRNFGGILTLRLQGTF